MVTNQNRLSAYLGFLLYFHKSQSYTLEVIHGISKCSKLIIRKLFKAPFFLVLKMESSKFVGIMLEL